MDSFLSRNDDHKDAHPHIVLSRDNDGELIPDFVLEPAQQNALSDLLELKLPSVEIYNLNRMRFSAAVHESASRFREYSRFFDEGITVRK